MLMGIGGIANANGKCHKGSIRIVFVQSAECSSLKHLQLIVLKIYFSNFLLNSAIQVLRETLQEMHRAIM